MEAAHEEKYSDEVLRDSAHFLILNNNVKLSYVEEDDDYYW